MPVLVPIAILAQPPVPERLGLLPPPHELFPWAPDAPLILGLSLPQWLGLLILAVTALIVGAAGQWLILRVSRSITGRTRSLWDDQFVALLPGPLGVFVCLLFLDLGVPILRLTPEAEGGLDVCIRTLLIVAATALVLRLIRFGAAVLEAYLTHQTDDENRKRSIHTQIALPRAILRSLAVVLGLALILLQFEVVRSVGFSLLASAGVAGLVLGLAAQRAASNLFAGIQLAIFQPVRIGDAVVVEGEWGWIEEIGLTNVVVKIWDLRRLVLPVSYFLEQPFQNWTRGQSDLLGTVFVYADYTVPVEAIRTRLKAILEATPLWDRRASGVQVTNLTGETVEARVLVSARDGGQLWDLRCHVREKLLEWLQSEGRTHLPINRVELQPADQVSGTR